MSFHRLVDAADHTAERLARATLDKLVGAGGNHVLHALRPSHRTGELGDQVGLDLLGVGVGLGIDILEDRALRGQRSACSQWPRPARPWRAA